MATLSVDSAATQRPHFAAAPTSELLDTEVWVDWQLCPTAIEPIDIAAPPMSDGEWSLGWQSRSARGGDRDVAPSHGRVSAIGHHVGLGPEDRA
jgi:hypothetical protein